MNKEKVAVLLDGGWILKVLRRAIHRNVDENDIYKFALSCVTQNDEKLFRIYYYDCAPYDGTRNHPISGKRWEFSQTQSARSRQAFLKNLSDMNHVAFRHGRLQLRKGKGLAFGWMMKDDAFADICFCSSKGTPPPVLLEEDVVPAFQQKAVDIKIGLDIAWLSAKKIVDKIILVTNDTDFVPAMKFARREAIQVVLVDFGGISSRLKSHADEIRPPHPMPAP